MTAACLSCTPCRHMQNWSWNSTTRMPAQQMPHCTSPLETPSQSSSCSWSLPGWIWLPFCCTWSWSSSSSCTNSASWKKSLLRRSLSLIIPCEFGTCQRYNHAQARRSINLQSACSLYCILHKAATPDQACLHDHDCRQMLLHRRTVCTQIQGIAAAELLGSQLGQPACCVTRGKAKLVVRRTHRQRKCRHTSASGAQ